jgi:uncharacterized protein YecT (DUF1311 family)
MTLLTRSGDDMRSTALLVAVLLLTLPATGAEKIPHEDTQLGMNDAAGKQLRSADAAMKKVFELLVARAGASADAVAKLRKSQAAWEAYRDAQLDAWWPSSDVQSYGSVYPMCFAMMKTQLTEARTVELRAMLDPQEGDVCSYQASQ